MSFFFFCKLECLDCGLFVNVYLLLMMRFEYRIFFDVLVIECENSPVALKYVWKIFNRVVKLG